MFSRKAASRFTKVFLTFSNCLQKNCIMTSPSSYLDTSCVWCSFNRLFSSHSFVMTISLSISNLGTLWVIDLACGLGGSFGLSRIGGDIDDSEDGERLFCWSSVKFKLTYDWKDFVLFVCFKIGIELRRVGESAIFTQQSFFAGVLINMRQQ